jgi:polysaccharide biosynthesis/export protein
MRFPHHLLVAMIVLPGTTLTFCQTPSGGSPYGHTPNAAAASAAPATGMPGARATRMPVAEGGNRTLGAPAGISTSPLAMTMTAAPVQLSPGDLLDIGVFDTPELSGRVRVNSKGEVTLPLIGALHVGGLAPEEVQQSIARHLKEGDFVRDPQVSVFVVEYANQAVYVIGEVVRPGPYPLMGSHRLLDFIAAAGGLTPVASKTVTLKSVANPAHLRTVELSSAGEDANPELAAGDTVVVSQAGMVYCLGDVRRPGGFLLNGGNALSVIQILALAEGTTSTASLSEARLIRTNPQGRQEISINLKKILKSRATDLKLQADDILFVPGSKTKNTLMTVQSVLPAAAGATIYRVP